MARSLCSLFAVGSLLSLAHCLPTPPYEWPEHWPHHPKLLSTEQLQEEQPTLNGLPSNSNVTLFAATLGVGVQNYTCNGTEFVQSVKGSGAEALLFDITELLKSGAENVNTVAEQCSNGQCPECLEINLIGNHYFHFFEDKDLNTPIFNLSHAKPPSVLAGTKIGDVPAPDSKDDVDWLFLTDGNKRITQHLTEVYRVDSNGGQPANGLSCHKKGKELSVPYAAQYWFYV